MNTILLSQTTGQNTFQAMLDYFQRLFTEAYNPWVIVIELLLIGLVVHITLRFLQGTRGARMMRGIGVVLVAGFVLMRMLAERFHWERIEFLYQYFVGAVFLMVLVIFQPELRRGFMHIGERFWFTSLFKKANLVIEPVVAAVQQMSKKRIGALIAIERSTLLGGVLESGVELDAAISDDLINTIFWPGSALHDLGLVIRGHRLAAAGCQFPLAESAEVDRTLGSRHRAAIGLTQESDAVVVVVSEETGTISLAYQGNLQRGLTPEILRTALYEKLVGRTQSAS